MSYSHKKNPARKVLVDLPNEEYHALPRLGHSDVLKIHKSPLEYRYSKENPPPKDLKAFVIGGATHAAILEPDKFLKQFEVMPEDFDGKGPRTVHYKEQVEILKAKKPHLRWLTPTEYDLVMNLAEAALAHPVLQSFLSKPHKVEGTAYFKTWRTPCKCRPDLVSFLGGRRIDVLDVKTCQDASPEGFAKAAAKWGYDVQQVFYRAGLEANDLKVGKFVFLAIEKTPPFSVGAYELSNDDLSIARKIVREACAMWRDCNDRDVWPGYGEGIHKLRLPAWRAPRDKALTFSPTSGKYLTVKQIATSFGITPQSVYRILYRTKELESLKFGGRIMINIDEWNKWWVLAEKNGDTPTVEEPPTKTIDSSKTIKATNHEDNEIQGEKL